MSRHTVIKCERCGKVWGEPPVDVGGSTLFVSGGDTSIMFATDPDLCGECLPRYNVIKERHSKEIKDFLGGVK